MAVLLRYVIGGLLGIAVGCVVFLAIPHPSSAELDNLMGLIIGFASDPSTR
jgi:hypothetical protein